MSKSTITHLPKDIEALIPENERTPLIKKIIEEATIGEFHDFKNVKYVCGKMVLVAMLQQVFTEGEGRLAPIAIAVVNGDSDEHADENDIANMKRDWINDGGTEASFKEFFGG